MAYSGRRRNRLTLHVVSVFSVIHAIHAAERGRRDSVARTTATRCDSLLWLGGPRAQRRTMRLAVRLATLLLLCASSRSGGTGLNEEATADVEVAPSADAHDAPHGVPSGPKVGGVDEPDFEVRAALHVTFDLNKTTAGGVGSSSSSAAAEPTGSSSQQVTRTLELRGDVSTSAAAAMFCAAHGLDAATYAPKVEGGGRARARVATVPFFGVVQPPRP